MSFGFIVTRHVNSEKTNKYWNQCVKLLRSYYPNNKIILIDDNSIQELVKAEYDYKNVTIIQSEYPKRGELLPFIYFLNNKWFDNAVIIHDSVFFHKRYNFQDLEVDVLPLWHFINNDSEIDNILRIADYLNNSNIIKSNILRWNENEWNGCFGAMCYINHFYLTKINDKYNLTNLINVVLNRSDRCVLERIFAIIFYLESSLKSKSFLGDINAIKGYYGYTFDDYIKLFNKKKVLLPVVKVWTGR
jgi:hypothetical protein